MTERWRKKLEGIDQVGPSDDVYERAKAGPALPETQSPMQRTSTRVATAIAAFVVFALAISLFAIPTLRLHDQSGALSPGGQLLPLWPARTTDEVQALQAQADSGDAAWALDPRQVATRFGQAVLGWPDVSASPVTSAGGCDVASGSYPSGSYAAAAYPGRCPAGFVGYGPTANLTPAGCSPSMLLCGSAAWQATTDPSAGQFMTFQLLPCDPSVCGQASFTETVEVFQPLRVGEGNVWSVLEASSPSSELAVSPGQTVSNGSSVSTGLRIPLSQQFGFGVHVGASDSCNQGVATDVFHSPGSANDAVAAAGSELGVNLGSREGTSCAQEEPGYVFVATSERSIVSDGVAIDPLQGTGGPGLLLTSFAAVPITFEWPAEAASSAPTPTVSTGWTTYTDPLGWTIDVPNGWTSGPIALEVGLTITTGAWFTSGAVAGLPTCQVSTPTPGATATSCREGPVASPGQVVLTVAHSTKNPDIRDDSPIPLDPDQFIQNQGEHGGAFFFADGIEFGISMYTRDDKPLSPAQEDVVRKMISSIRFQPWSPGEIRGDFAALNPTANRPASWKQDGLDWQRIGGRTFVYMENGQNGVLLGPMPDCGPGAIQDAATNVRAALLECPDGTKGGWTIDGQPLMDNSPSLTDPVPPSHVVRAWDGTLISPVVPLP